MIADARQTVVAALQERDLIAQLAGGADLEEHLQQSRTLYCGFDPTADSLHIGSLVPLLALRRFQLAGHKPIALVGGATGLIGDPSHKAEERQLNTPEVVGGWAERLRQQLARFIDFDSGASGALLVNNLEWFGPMTALDFLRDIGKHFSVNAMIHKEAVRQRIEREETGISFTEFSYALLQSFDFAELYRKFGCTLQIGGSDQWGNITGGIDLARRLYRAQVYGATLPLVTKADGTKFGKTESGTLWLDEKKTSPYAFYQFWLNTADADVYRFLGLFTFLPMSEIADLERADSVREGRREAQRILARELTMLVHGSQALAAVERITAALFGGRGMAAMTESDFAQLKQDGVPHHRLSQVDLQARTLAQLMVEMGVVASGRLVRDALARGGVLLNDRSLSLEDNDRLAELMAPGGGVAQNYYLLQFGKKRHHLIEVV